MMIHNIPMCDPRFLAILDLIQRLGPELDVQDFDIIIVDHIWPLILSNN